jgi:hypothetical protein
LNAEAQCSGGGIAVRELLLNSYWQASIVLPRTQVVVALG